MRPLDKYDARVLALWVGLAVLSAALIDPWCGPTTLALCSLWLVVGGR
jgi:hypothetical protein